MAAVIEISERRTGRNVEVLPLENGDHLTAREFLRRYEAMPEVKKAELIHGIVYMASPIRVDRHGEPDSLIQGWLCNYSVATPGVKHAINSTVRLGPDDVVQPDGFLRLLPECGGQPQIDPKGYLAGPPELVVEVAASSASIDTREKLHSYRRAGVRECLVWRTQENALDWWRLEGDDYVLIPASADGTIRSEVFPGLWLDLNALLAGNGNAVLARLQEGLASSAHQVFSQELAKKAAG